MTSIYDNMGYMRNDNRASGGGLEQEDMLGCNHCQASIRKSHWQKNGGWCHGCAKPVCLLCAKKLTATPPEPCRTWTQFVDEELQKLYVREQNAKILGL